MTGFFLETTADGLLQLMGKSSELGVEDMIQLQDLHEGSLLYNLALRYREKHIYTFTVCRLILGFTPRREPPCVFLLLGAHMSSTGEYFVCGESIPSL